MKFFSYKDRPVHLGPFPLETLRRADTAPDLSVVPPMTELDFSRHDPNSIAHAIKRYLAMLDIGRAGMMVHEPAEVPEEHQQRTNHLKEAGYYFGASMIGACEVTAEETAAEALAKAGIQVDTKCCDGICGVCVMNHLGGEIEHRDFVLSKQEREQKLILCCSRAEKANGVVRLAL